MTSTPSPARWRRRGTSLVAAAGAAALLCALSGAGAAHADTRPGPSAAQSALTSQYSTLSGALINFYAGQAGQTLSQYLSSQKVLLAGPQPAAAGLPGAVPASPASPGTPGAGTSLPTVSAPAPTPAAPAPAGGLSLGTAGALGAAAIGGQPVTAATVSDLNSKLTTAGIGIDTSKYNSLDALAKSIASQSGNADAQVTLSAARWMAQLSTLHTPGLVAPTAGMPAVPGLAKDSLVFGLFADKSLATMVNNSPDLLAAAGTTGLGTAALSQAWNSSMMETYANSQGDFSRVLPDPCTGGMLAVMASGDPASMKKTGGSCAPACVTGGMYLNAQTSELFSPNATDLTGNPLSSVWRASTLPGLQQWQQDQMGEQNPGLTAALNNDQTNPLASASCNAAGLASGAAVSSVLPGVFGLLTVK